MTTRNLDAAIGFFIEVLGAEEVYRTPPQDLAEGSLGKALGVCSSGTVRHAALRLGPTDNLELWQFDVPDAASDPPRNSDVGGGRLAFFVDDVDVAAERLSRYPGVVMFGVPQTITTGPIAGDRWIYLRTPVGYIELVFMPDGALPYERTTSARRRPSARLTWSLRPERAVREGPADE
ncbi:VOC family protein [Streptomyces sp. NPDC001450]